MHIIYRTTNLINDKIYVGIHKTDKPYKFDGYWGSGKILQQAIDKYGVKNFERKTLFVFESEEDAFTKEAEIVNENFVQQENVYNLIIGGKGCGSGENSPMYGKHLSAEARKKISIANTGKRRSEEMKQRLRELNTGKRHTEETKKKMSIAHKGIYPSEATRKRMSEGLTGEKNGMFGRHHSATTRKRMSDDRTGEKNGMFGRRHSTESLKKMSENSKGRVCSEEIRKKLSKANKGEKHWNYGKHHSEETKQKIRESQQGKTLSKEHRQKISEAGKGRVHSEETKQKMSENNGNKLAPKIINQRLQSIRNIPKTWGWQSKLALEWGVVHTTVSKFVNKYQERWACHGSQRVTVK